VCAKTGEKNEESRPIKRALEPRTETVGLPRDNEKRGLHRHLNPELIPWTFLKIKTRESNISRFGKLEM
jgi:hypothetical protein